MPNLMQRGRYKIILTRRSCTIGSEVPVGCTVEGTRDVRLFTQVCIDQGIGQCGWVERIGKGGICKILVQVIGPCLCEGTAFKVFPSSINSDGHIGSDQHRPNVHRVIESEDYFFGKTIVVHNNVGIADRRWGVKRRRRDVGKCIYGNSFQASVATKKLFTCVRMMPFLKTKELLCIDRGGSKEYSHEQSKASNNLGWF